MAITNQFVSLQSVLKSGAVGKDGKITPEFQKKLQEWDIKLSNTISLQQQILAAITNIGANATVAGRSGTLQSGIVNLDATGVLASLVNVADRSTDHLTDGTGSPLSGGKRGFIAVGANNRLASSFRNNPLNVQGSYTGANPLTQDGLTTNILVAANTQQFGPGQLNYSAGSVDPGTYGLKYVYGLDPDFLGGLITYLTTTVQSALSGNDALVYFGQITTAAGGGGTGTGGGGGTCFSGDAPVEVPGGKMRFDLLGDRFVGKTLFGWREMKHHHHPYNGEMRIMDEGWLVTPTHQFLVSENWIRAKLLYPKLCFFSGTVHTAEVITHKEEERHFILGNGSVAHNLSPLN